MSGAIVQEHETFVPRVLAVTRGSTVSFPNADPIFHNVFSLSARRRSTSAATRVARSRSRVFPKAGLVKVYCHIHSQMSASIMVLDHPYLHGRHATTATFEIADVPAGPLHDRRLARARRRAARSIEVTAGGQTEIELSAAGATRLA